MNECSECEGSGIVGPVSLSVVAVDDHQTCPECKGSGERPCILCKDTGRLVMHERHEAGGGGSNVERDCPNCATKGTGEGQ